MLCTASIATGTELDPDEIDTLERLCDAAAQAYTSVELRRYRAEPLNGLPAMGDAAALLLAAARLRRYFIEGSFGIR